MGPCPVNDIGLVVIIAIAVIFVAPYLYMRISAARAVGKPAPPMARINGKATDTRQPLNLYFMSKNCSTCKKMTPFIEQLMLNKTAVVMVDINHSPELASDFHVYGTPTLMVVKHGVIEKVNLGKLSEKKINQFFNS